MWYTPWAFQKYEVGKSRDSERELRKKGFEESLIERILLQHAAVIRCLSLKMDKQRIHNRYKCFADLNQ